MREIYLIFVLSFLSRVLSSSLDPVADEPSPVQRTSSSSSSGTLVDRFGMDLDMCFARSAINRCLFEFTAGLSRRRLSLLSAIVARSSDAGFDDELSEARPIGG